MNECNSIEAPNIYPNLNDQQQLETISLLGLGKGN